MKHFCYLNKISQVTLNELILAMNDPNAGLDKIPMTSVYAAGDESVGTINLRDLTPEQVKDRLTRQIAADNLISIRMDFDTDNVVAYWNGHHFSIAITSKGMALASGTSNLEFEVLKPVTNPKTLEFINILTHEAVLKDAVYYAKS